MVKDIADMNKVELDRFAKEEYGVDLDRREKISEMRSDLSAALKTRGKDVLKEFFKSGADRRKTVHQLAEFTGKSLDEARSISLSWWQGGLVDYNLARGSVVLKDNSRGGD